MLSLDLHQILLPKNAIFSFAKKRKFRQPQIQQFANLVTHQYFRHDGQFSSFCQFLVVKNEIRWSLLITPTTTAVVRATTYCVETKSVSQQSLYATKTIRCFSLLEVEA